MLKLGYDDVFLDSMGNVIGRMGNRLTSIMFDSHMDTVECSNPEKWKVAPFSGEIHNGRLYGRGSIDMKEALAASVYGPVLARDLDWIEGRTAYVTCTVNEKDCDGENLKSLSKEKDLPLQKKRIYW